MIKYKTEFFNKTEIPTIYPKYGVIISLVEHNKKTGVNQLYFIF